MRQLYWKVMSSVIVASSVIISCGGDSKGTEPIIVDPSSSSGVVGSSSSAPPLSSAIVPSSSSGGGSSSSVTPSSSSSGGGSSSSVTPSSSSSGGGSSSSVAPSSSSSGGGSSSSVKPSSSSVSSSSWSPFNPKISYGEFTDTRNGKVYKTFITGGMSNVEYMAQNLDIGTMVAGSTDQSNNSVIEKYCYNDDPANCAKYGGLYQWSEAMGFPSDCNTNQTGSAGCASTITAAGTFGVQHQGICPSGWHIMNEIDWNLVWNGGSQTASRLRSQIAYGTWSGSNNTGFSALPGGMYETPSNFSTGGFINIGTQTTIWRPEEVDANRSSSMPIQGVSTSIYVTSGDKTDGYSIRCVKDY